MSLRDRAIQAEREARDHWFDVVGDELGNHEIPWKDRLDAAIRAGITEKQIEILFSIAPFVLRRWLDGRASPNPSMQDLLQRKLYEELQKRRT